MIRSSNPAMNDNTFKQAIQEDYGVETMSVVGTINKTAILLLLLVITAGISWRMFYGAADLAAGAAAMMQLILIGGIGGLIVAFITIFNKKWSMITGPIYALLEGLAIGGISAIMELQFPGIVVPAVMLTFGVLAIMLTIYRTGIIKVTNKLRIGITAAMGAIFLIYMATFIMGFFGATIPYIHGSGPIGIGFSVVVIGVCSFMLLLDFDRIQRGSEMGAPKYMEWYCAFGLLVTLIWLYMEFLRLLAKLRSR